MAAHGILCSITVFANFARTDIGSQDVPCPFSWSPLKTTRSGFSKSKTRERRVVVKLSDPVQGSRSVSRQVPGATEKWRSATCSILNLPSLEKCRGCARGDSVIPSFQFGQVSESLRGGSRFTPCRMEIWTDWTLPSAEVVGGSIFSNPYQGISSPNVTSSSVIILAFSSVVISLAVFPVRYHKYNGDARKIPARKDKSAFRHPSIG